MNSIIKNKKVIRGIKSGLFFLLISILSFVVFTEDFFSYIVLTGLPIQNIEKLFTFHMISNSLLFLSIGFLSVFFFRLYFKLKKRGVPFVGFFWILGAFKAFISLIFVMNIISTWRAYYWIDGTLRMFAAIFALGAAIAFYKSFNAIINLKSPQEYRELTGEIKRLLDIQEEVLNTKIEQK